MGTQPPHFEEITLEGVAFSYGDHNILSKPRCPFPPARCLSGRVGLGEDHGH